MPAMNKIPKSVCKSWRNSYGFADFNQQLKDATKHKDHKVIPQRINEYDPINYCSSILYLLGIKEPKCSEYGKLMWETYLRNSK